MKILTVFALSAPLVLGGCAGQIAALEFISSGHLADYFPGTTCTTQGCVDESNQRVRLYESTPSTYGKMAGKQICKQVLATLEQRCVWDDGSVVLGAPDAPTHIEPYKCEPLNPRTDCYGYSNKPRKYKSRY